MAKKRKTLLEDFQEIIDSGDMDKFRAVFEKCEVSATARSRTTENAFSFKGLTEEHVAFLAENGIDLNADCGWGETPATKLADDVNLLKILIAHGADINFAADARTGNALLPTHATTRLRPWRISSHAERIPSLAAVGINSLPLTNHSAHATTRTS